ncbi:hypothetical protein BC458_03045 [Neisseria meningitidis]|nr:hypothetical protein BC458_03045 [Neisseria meningitidis]
MNPNPFRFRLITLNEVSMPIGNGQIVGFERLLFESNVLNRLFCTAFGKQGVAFFQTTCLYPFSLTVKRVDFIGNAGVGFLKNSVLNILFQMKEMPSEN